MEKKYEWKLRNLAKDVDPDEAVKELESVENIYGALTAENILNFASQSNTKLHSLFTWDDTEAARQYRLSQARTILNNIQVNIISDGEERKMSVYEVIVSDKGRVYKNVQDMTTNELTQVKLNTVKQLQALRHKLTLYKNFSTVVSKLDEALKIVLDI